jgi:hypothetical protein
LLLHLSFIVHTERNYSNSSFVATITFAISKSRTLQIITVIKQENGV